MVEMEGNGQGLGRWIWIEGQCRDKGLVKKDMFRAERTGRDRNRGIWIEIK
jgi:hypothetical protein